MGMTETEKAPAFAHWPLCQSSEVVYSCLMTLEGFGRCLVLVKRTSLCCYMYHQGEDRSKPLLRFIGSQVFESAVISAAEFIQQESENLLIAFEGNVFSRYQFSASRHCFITSPSHPPIALPVPEEETSDSPLIRREIQIDPTHRVAAMTAGVTSRFLAVVPLRDGADAPYLVPLPRLDVLGARSIAFLAADEVAGQAHKDPLLAVLHETAPTCAGSLLLRSDTGAVTVFAVSDDSDHWSPISTTEGLPHDTYKVLAVPNDPTGFIAISPNCVAFASSARGDTRLETVAANAYYIPPDPKRADATVRWMDGVAPREGMTVFRNTDASSARFILPPDDFINGPADPVIKLEDARPIWLGSTRLVLITGMDRAVDVTLPGVDGAPFGMAPIDKADLGSLAGVGHVHHLELKGGAATVLATVYTGKQRIITITPTPGTDHGLTPETVNEVELAMDLTQLSTVPIPSLKMETGPTPLNRAAETLLATSSGFGVRAPAFTGITKLATAIEVPRASATQTFNLSPLTFDHDLFHVVLVGATDDRPTKRKSHARKVKALDKPRHFTIVSTDDRSHIIEMATVMPGPGPHWSDAPLRPVHDVNTPNGPVPVPETIATARSSDRTLGWVVGHEDITVITIGPSGKQLALMPVAAITTPSSMGVIDGLYCAAPVTDGYLAAMCDIDGARHVVIISVGPSPRIVAATHINRVEQASVAIAAVHEALYIALDGDLLCYTITHDATRTPTTLTPDAIFTIAGLPTIAANTQAPSPATDLRGAIRTLAAVSLPFPGLPRQHHVAVGLGSGEVAIYSRLDGEGGARLVRQREAHPIPPAVTLDGLPEVVKPRIKSVAWTCPDKSTAIFIVIPHARAIFSHARMITVDQGKIGSQLLRPHDTVLIDWESRELNTRRAGSQRMVSAIPLDHTLIFVHDGTLCVVHRKALTATAPYDGLSSTRMAMKETSIPDIQPPINLAPAEAAAFLTRAVYIPEHDVFVGAVATVSTMQAKDIAPEIVRAVVITTGGVLPEQDQWDPMLGLARFRVVLFDATLTPIDEYKLKEVTYEHVTDLKLLDVATDFPTYYGDNYQCHRQAKWILKEGKLVKEARNVRGTENEQKIDQMRLNKTRKSGVRQLPVVTTTYAQPETQLTRGRVLVFDIEQYTLEMMQQQRADEEQGRKAIEAAAEEGKADEIKPEDKPVDISRLKNANLEDFSDDIPDEPDQPQQLRASQPGDVRLRLVGLHEERKAVNAVEAVNRKLVVGAAYQSLGFELLDAHELLQNSFVFTCVHTTSMATLKSFVALGDAIGSVYLMVYKAEKQYGNRLTVLARHQLKSEASAVQFLPHGDLFVSSTDPNGSILISHFDVRDPIKRNKGVLDIISEIHTPFRMGTGVSITRHRQRNPRTNGFGDHRYFNVVGHLDGAVSAISPIPHREHRLLERLSMAVAAYRALDRTAAGTNFYDAQRPLRTAGATPIDVARAEPELMLGGVYLHEFALMPRPTQEIVAGKLGLGVDVLLNEIALYRAKMTSF